MSEYTDKNKASTWSHFATTLTEDQPIDDAKVMAKVLPPHGYDVLTVGVLELGRGTTRFAPDEQRTMMTL